MSTWQAWYQSARARRQLVHWAAAGQLDRAGLDEALRLIGDPPGVADWRRFWLAACGWLGVVMLGAAAVCFIAANWSEMGRFARLGLAQGALVAAALVAVFARRWRAVAVLALWLACVLLGVLLALVGQTYQLGADTWQLFALWAALMLPWALASRHPAVWLLFVMLVNLAVWLAGSGRLLDELHLLLFVGANLLLLAGWELAVRRRGEFMAGVTGPRLIAALLLAGTSLRSFDDWWHVTGLAASLPWLIWLGTALALAGFYLHVRRDLVVIAFTLLSVIVVVTGHLALTLFDSTGDVVAAATMLAVLLLAEAALAAAWLRRLARQGGAQ